MTPTTQPGAAGLAVVVESTQPVVAAEPGVGVPAVEVRVGYEGFRSAYGGGWADRLTVSRASGCPVDPADPVDPVDPLEVGVCEVVEPVPSENDEGAETLSFTTSAPTPSGTEPEPGGADGAVVFLVSGSTGNYGSTPLSVSSAWQVGEGSGEFSYAYPFVLPSVQGVQVPELGLSYSSGSVDAMSVAENGQASQAGVGWDLGVGHVARTYASCEDDGEAGKGDQCWKTTGGGVLVEELTMVLAGRSAELVRVGTTDQFRLKDDPGWRITRLGGPAGGGGAGAEKFRVQAPDGTTYWFGQRAVAAASVWTVPVFGNNAGEACHQAGSPAGSWCQQPWRWSLDRVVDAAGNVVLYDYATEQNFYARWGEPGNQTAYDRAGRLTGIRYGLRPSDGPERARGVVTVSSVLRCTTRLTDPAADCSSEGGNGPRQRPDLWPDVPADLICDSGQPCANGGPSFFSLRRYDRVSTETVSGFGGSQVTRAVDRYALEHTMPDPDKDEQAGTNGPDDPDLWLRSVTRAGLGGDGADAGLPSVNFTGVVLGNRVDVDGGQRAFAKYRVASVRTETGGRVQVEYGHAEGRACDEAYVAGRDRWASDRECFAQRWAAPGSLPPGQEPPWEWFHKYVVRRLALGDDAIGYRLGQPAPVSVLGKLRVYDYDYTGAPAWRFTDSFNVELVDESWDDWRGYERTFVRTRSVDAQGQPTGGSVSVRRLVRFRGMDQSRIDLGENYRTVRIDTEEHAAASAEPLDRNYLEGRVAEEELLDPRDLDPGGSPRSITREYHDFDAFVTAVSATNRTAHLVFPVRDRTHTRIAPGGGGGTVRTRQVDYTVDTGGADGRGIRAGVVTQTLDAGDVSLGTDTECTTTRWASNSTPNPTGGSAGEGDRPDYWIRAVSGTSTYTGTCTTGTLVARTRTFYDGGLPGDPVDRITDGFPTRTDTSTTPTDGPGTVITTTTGYDRYGRVTRTTDGRTNATTTTYNPGGDPDDLLAETRVVNPLTHATSTRLEPWRGQPVRVTDPNNQSTTLGYDGLGVRRRVI